MKKTNAIRLLEQAGIDYEARMYPVDESDLSGTHAAAVLGLPAGQVFKTLVLRGAKTGYFVCCIPVDQDVDLKKAAKAVGDKKAEMLPGGHEEKVPDLFRRFCTKMGTNFCQRGHTRGNGARRTGAAAGIDQCCLYRADAITCAVWRIHMNS